MFSKRVTTPQGHCFSTGDRERHPPGMSGPFPARLGAMSSRIRNCRPATCPMFPPMLYSPFGPANAGPYPARLHSGWPCPRHAFIPLVGLQAERSRGIPVLMQAEVPNGGLHCVSHFDEVVVGSRCPLRSPHAPLASEDAHVHLHGTQRHPHHRPAADHAAGQHGLWHRARHRAPRAGWSSLSAPRSRPRKPSRPRPTAAACPT